MGFWSNLFGAPKNDEVRVGGRDVKEFLRDEEGAIIPERKEPEMSVHDLFTKVYDMLNSDFNNVTSDKWSVEAKDYVRKEITVWPENESKYSLGAEAGQFKTGVEIGTKATWYIGKFRSGDQRSFLNGFSDR